MSITPFHLACHCEERLRAQFEILDQGLGNFVQIQRRMSLTDSRAVLQFGSKPALGEDFVAHATMNFHLVPQKEKQTAFNCTLDCPATKLRKNFRLLINSVEETETQILKVLDFLQKAFEPLGYKTQNKAPAQSPTVEAAVAAAVSACSTLPTTNATANNAKPVIGTAEQAQASVEGAKKLPSGNQYIYEKPTQGEAVRMRGYDGKYVPEGELPATLRIKE